MKSNDLQITYKNVEELKAYDKNPRKNDEAIPYLKKSIEEFGFKVPVVVDKDNVIVAGHSRIIAAKELGMKKVPCIVADDLSEEQIKAFRLADNKVSEFSLWDFDLLNQELEDLADFDMSEFGFNTAEDINLDDFFEDKEPASEEDNPKEEQEVQCPHCKMFFKLEK